MHVAVVRDRRLARGAPSSLRPLAPEAGPEDVAEAVAEELHDAGHTTMVCEADDRLLSVLGDFMPGRSGCPTGLVFNLVRRTAGDDQRMHTPAILEMAGVAYTGPSPSGHAIALDHATVRALLRRAGIPTPDYWLARAVRDVPPDVAWPVLVRSRDVDAPLSSRIATCEAELADALEEVNARCERGAVVERYIEGVDVTAALLGSEGDVEVLPLLDEDAESRLISGGTRPPVEPSVAATIRRMSAAAFEMCRCQDYATARLRVDAAGDAFIVALDAMPSLATGGSLALAAASAGYSRAALVERIVDIAHLRYFGVTAPRFDLTGDRRTSWRQS